MIRRGKDEHFTVMVIPHTEKKIFTFQVSNLIVLYFIMVSVLLLFSLYLYQTKKQSLARDLGLMRQHDDEYRGTYLQYTAIISENKKMFAQYREELDKILKVLGHRENDPKEIAAAQRKAAALIERKYQYGGIAVPTGITELYILQQEVEKAVQLLTEVKKTLNNREAVLHHIPGRWPILGHAGYKTSGFGQRYSPFVGRQTFHTGVDIAAAPRTPIIAAANGIVSFSGIKSGYGNLVIIDHEFGYKTLYGHTARNLVREGQTVKRGQKIALLGKSGRATGYHVHFEVRINNEPVDPWPYITTDL